MGNLNDTKILSNDVFKAIELILAEYEGFVFGGSLALNAYDIIDRKINDLDILAPMGVGIQNYGNIGKYISYGTKDFSIMDYNKRVQRIKLLVNDVKVDLFKIRDINYSKQKVSFLGKDFELNIQDPLDIISIKTEYAKKIFNSCNKHKEDLDVIRDRLLRVCKEYYCNTIKIYKK